MGKSLKIMLILSMSYIFTSPIYASCEHGYYTQGGNGTEQSPYLVSNAPDIRHAEQCSGIYYKQVADITMDGQVNSFSKKYDGDYYTVNTVHGMTWMLYLYGEIKNLTIVSDYHTPIYTAYTGSILKGIDVRGSQVKYPYATQPFDGTIVERLWGTMDQCSFVGSILLYREYSSDSMSLGGIVGFVYNGGSVSNSYSNMTITMSSGDRGPNITGITYGLDRNTTMKNCYAVYNITNPDKQYNERGLAGYIDSTSILDNNYHTVESVASIVGSTRITDTELRADNMSERLNKNTNVWRKGEPYPVFRKEVSCSIGTQYYQIGDNTPIYLKLNFYGSLADFNQVQILANNNTLKTVLPANDIIINTDALNNNISLQVKLLFNGYVVNTSNTININKINLLNNTLIASNNKTGLQSFIVIDDVERYFENNAANQKLVADIKAKSAGTFLIYNDVCDVLIPLLKT